MTKAVTSITLHVTAEGQRVSYTYSEINQDGALVSSNNRASMVVLDNEKNTTLLSAIQTVTNHVKTILNQA